MLETFPCFDLSDATLAQTRANLFELYGDLPLPDGMPIRIERRSIKGPPGAPPLDVLIYRPTALTGVTPGLLHIHGGGYVIGSVTMSKLANCDLAIDLGCTIVSVDYRLAPETRHPGPVEDCHAALVWFQENCTALGVDPARLAVTGESAGGGLAAALALLARDRGEAKLMYQLLTYPMLDDRSCVNGAHPFAGDHIWTNDNNRFGWAALLGVPPGSPGVSPYAAAARADDLAGLPPACIWVGALDLFIDENIDYAGRLSRAGVPVELHVYPGAFHGFDMVPDAQVAIAARRDSRAALRRAWFGSAAKPAAA